MPRPAKGARLWLRPADREAGRVRPATWIILDRGKQHRTGLGAHEGEAAERALAAHIAAKYQPERRSQRHPSEIDLADVIAIYMDDRPPAADAASNARFAGRCERLLTFWGRRPLSDVTVRTCQDYVAWRAGAERGSKGGRRAGQGGARRDLEDLRAAIAYHAAKRLHLGHIETWLPERGRPRDRCLTRSEAAALLWACWRATERQRGERTAKRTLRHIARFILLGLYTGTRAGAIATASFAAASGRSYVDLDLGVFFRLAEGRKPTKKRQPPVPLPERLLAHMRRWRRFSESDDRSHGYVVEYRGKPVSSVKVGFARAVALADLGAGVTPHTLRHTAATWLRQRGVSQFDAAGFLGMSMQTLDRVYEHQDQRHLRHVADAMDRRPGNVMATIGVNRSGRRTNRAV